MAGRRKKAVAGGEGAEPSSAEAPRVDALLEELEQVVEQLESGDLPLEQALARFESGIRLAREGARVLDTMEQRVDVLLADRDETAPFEGDDGDDDDDEL